MGFSFEAHAIFLTFQMRSSAMIWFRKIFLYILICLLCISCEMIEARDNAYAGRDALKSCDFYNAYKYFSESYALVKDDQDVSLGYAFSCLLAILDSEPFSGILMRLGMTSTIGEFCIDRTNRPNDETQTNSQDRCSGDDVNIHSMQWPHPCSETEHCNDYISYIDTSLQWHDIIDAIDKNRRELLRSSNIITDVANHMKAPYVINDVLGYSSLTIHQADLYLLSAAVKTLVFASDIASAYENKFSVYDTLDDRICTHQASIINQYIGVANSTPDLFQSMVIFTDMMSDIEKAFVHAHQLRESNDNKDSQSCGEAISIFNWTNVPYGVMDNIISISSAFRQKPTVIQDIFSPEISVDLSALLKHLPIRNANEPIVSCDGDGSVGMMGIYIEFLNRYITPPLFEPDIDQFKLHHDISYRLSSGWRKWTPADLL